MLAKVMGGLLCWSLLALAGTYFFSMLFMYAEMRGFR